MAPSSDMDAKPATVTLRNGILMIAANNSDLSQILREVAKISGTTVHGAVQSTRVYGVYGPQSPRDVLTDLLAGLGYNFIMSGVTSQGGPRDLVLTPAKVDAPQVTTNSPAAAATNPDSVEADVPDEEEPGPGGVLHVPPPPPENLHERVEQNLQRLQQMQDQLKQPDGPPQ